MHSYVLFLVSDYNYEGVAADTAQCCWFYKYNSNGSEICDESKPSDNQNCINYCNNGCSKGGKCKYETHSGKNTGFGCHCLC